MTQRQQLDEQQARAVRRLRNINLQINREADAAWKRKRIVLHGALCLASDQITRAIINLSVTMKTR